MKIIPFGDQILVKPIEKRDGPLGEEGNLSEYGEIVAVGSGVATVKVGDRVGFSVFGVEKLMIDEQKYYFIRENAEFLLCTIENELPTE